MTELSIVSDKTGVSEAPTEDLLQFLEVTQGLSDLLGQLDPSYELVADSIALRRIVASNEVDKRNLANRVTRPPGSR